MSIFHAPGRVPVLAEMLRRCLGEVPPIEGLATWEQALGDPQQLNLYFEVSLPTPKGYRKYLVDRLPQRVLVHYVLESATRTAADGRALEGATKVDAVLIAPKTGFAVLFEAKVLADAAAIRRSPHHERHVRQDILQPIRLKAHLGALPTCR
jgi:hypothetical protein